MGETLGPILGGGTGGGGGGGTITSITSPTSSITVTNGAGPVVNVDLPVLVTAGTVGDASHVSQITVDVYGRVTAGSNVSIQIAESQVTNLVSDLALKAPLASPPLTGVPTAPTAAPGTNTTQIATTAFVTAATGGTTGPFLTVANNLSDVNQRGTSRFNLRIPTIASVQAVATSNVNIAAPGASIDGYSFTTSGQDSVLLTGQSTSSQNGIWTWNGAASPLTRQTDFPAGGSITNGRFVSAQQGTVNAGTMWVLAVPANAPITVDTTAQTWTSLNFLGTANNESVIRANTLNQMGAPTGAVTWNNQALTNLSSLSMTDGTAGDGKITAALNAPLLAFFDNTGSTNAQAQLGLISSNPTLAFGPNNAAADVTLARTATSTGTYTGRLNFGVISATDVGLWQSNNTITAGGQWAGPALGINVGQTQTINYASWSFASGLFAIGGTFAAQQSPNAFGGLTGFVVNPTFKNVAGNNVTLTTNFAPLFSFAPTYQADTTTLTTIGSAVLINVGAALSAINAGAISAGSIINVASSATVNSGQTLTSLTDFQVSEWGQSGTVTTHIGLDVGALTKATTSIGIRLAAMNNPLQMAMRTTGPDTGNLTSNTNVVMTMYHGATNYYLLFAFNDGGTVRYKYLQLNSTGTTWATGTTLPT